MKRTGIFLIFICASLFLFGCEGKVKEPVEITFIHGWGSTDDDHVAMRKIYSDFEKDNPDIKLNMLSMPTNSEMKRLVEDMLNTGNIPDIVFTAGEGENSIYSFMLENNLLLDLMPYIEEDEEFGSNISPITKEMWTMDGKLYTVSDVLILSGGYWYNRDIFKAIGQEEPPKTWEEFYQMLDLVEAWVEEENNTVEVVRPSLDAYLYMADNLLFSEEDLHVNGHLTTERDAFEKVCDLWENIDDRVKINNRNYSYRDETALFNDGRLAIYINGVWAASSINEKIDAGYALLPGNGEDTYSCQSAALGYILGKTGNEEKTDASVRFVKYMLSQEVQKRILLETQQVPENPNINIDDYYRELERFCLAVKTVQNAKTNIDFPHNLWSEDQRSALESNLPLFLEDQITRDELGSRVGVFN